MHDERMVTYKKYMERIGEFSPALVRVGNFAGGRLCAVQEILEEGETHSNICKQRLSGSGLLSGSQRKGLRIPEDISIVGYNDIAVANYLVPPLTTSAPAYGIIG